MGMDEEDETTGLLRSEEHNSDKLANLENMPEIIHSYGSIDSEDEDLRADNVTVSVRSYSESGSDAEFPHRASGHGHVQQNESPRAYVFLGFTFAILAGLCFTSSNVMVKFVPTVKSFHLLLVRCVSQMFMMLPIMWYSGSRLLGPPELSTRLRILAQGILGGILLLCIFEAVARLPLGDSAAIFFSSPAFTMIFSCIILRDHCGVYRVMVATSLLSGVVILSRPPSIFPASEASSNVTNASEYERHREEESTHRYEHHYHRHAAEGYYDAVGIGTALAVPILSATIVIITRQVKHVHYSVLVFWFAIGGIPVSLIGIQFIDPTPAFSTWDTKEWVFSFVISLVGVLGSIVMTQAIFWVTPPKVMVVRSFEVVSAYILQVTVFDCPPHWSDLGGTILVLAAVLSMAIEDCVMDKTDWRYM